ncbi:hypothetical protein ACC720_35030 [Rhizobium ruizarguesonis]
MTKLISDVFIRRLAQIFILCIGVAIVAVCACFVVISIQYKFASGWSMEDGWKYSFLQIISFPFDSSLGTFITGLSAIIPTMLSAVCFAIDRTATPPKASTDLNHVGHAFVLMLAIGIGVSIIAIFLVGTIDFSNAVPAAMKDIVATRLRALFGAFLAVQGTYLTHLLKEKDT